MNLPNKLTILRVIMIPFFVAALLYDGGANQNMRYVAAALFIIASLTDMLDNLTLCSILKNRATVQQGVEALMDAALERGGRDNITIILVEVEEVRA